MNATHKASHSIRLLFAQEKTRTVEKKFYVSQFRERFEIKSAFAHKLIAKLEKRNKPHFASV